MATTAGHKTLREKQKAARDRSARRHAAVAQAIGLHRAYDASVMRLICDEIAAGLSVRKATAKVRDDMGLDKHGNHGLHESQFFRWIASHKEAEVMYEAAKEKRVETFVEDTMEIADRLSEEPNSRAVRIKARHWIASKLKPRVYGDQVDHRHSGAVTLVSLLAASYEKHFLGKTVEPVAIEKKP